ncbi:MAG: GNAT family N-acetyltransferase, partial [Erysipelotrichaceae bacterium]|nr:GNAT family N-acetyltransferase [Erysipelotrichaceae bacterium]
EPKPYEQFERELETRIDAYPFLVAKHNGQVIGYAGVHPAFEKEAYRQCMEISIYFREGNHYHLADALMERVEQACRDQDIRWLIACITDTNAQSLAFHQRHGYHKTGQLPKCGYKHDQWNGVIWMSKDLSEHKEYYAALNATVVGDVQLEKDVSIWYHAVLRGDSDSIQIGQGTNIQDLCLIHTDAGFPVSVGQRVTIGHAAIVHGATIEDEVLIGMGAVLMNGCHIGSHSIIGANTLIPEGMRVPENSIVVGSPGKVIKTVTNRQIREIKESAEHYIESARKGL